MSPEKRESGRTPSMNCDSRMLEVEPQRELQFPHRGSTFDVCYFPVIAALAINARVGSVISAERVHRVVEEVKCVHAELSFDSLCDRDSLD